VKIPQPEISANNIPLEKWEVPVIREIRFAAAEFEGYDGDDGSIGGYDS